MKRAKRVLCLLLALAMMLSLVACGSDNSETNETQGIVGAYEGDEFGNGAVGENGCVSSVSPVSSQVGIDILKAGGNAVDAAIATILTVGVVEPHHSGIGGSGFMTVYLADEDRYTTFEYLETIPAGAYEDYYVKKDYFETCRVAGVPGQVAGLAMALEKYGTMSWHDVLQPVIKVAREGFTLTKIAADAMKDYADKFAKPGREELYKLFTDEGFMYEEGDTFKNEDLANTLETLANEGWQSFYTGSIAKRIAEGMRLSGSLMDEADLAAYYATEREPLVADYYGYKVVTVPNPSVGGTLLVGALNIMESLDIKQYEQGSVEYWKVFNESVRFSSINAYAYSGDPAYYVAPKEQLSSQEYADERAKLFNMDCALENVPKSTDMVLTRKEVANSADCATAVSPSINPAAQGAPVVEAFGAKAATDISYSTETGVSCPVDPKDIIGKQKDPGLVKAEEDGLVYDGSENTLNEQCDTTHIVAMDKDGNIVSSTNTIGNSWGAYYVTPGLGFVYNNHLNNASWTSTTSPDYFADGGKKTRSTMAPTIVTKDGKPVMAVGSPGSTVIPPVIASTINNVLLYGYNVQQAINLPRVFAMDRTSDGPLTDLTAETGRMKKSDIRLLEVFGYSVKSGTPDYAEVQGGIAALQLVDGKIYGGGDPRRGYQALAY